MVFTCTVSVGTFNSEEYSCSIAPNPSWVAEQVRQTQRPLDQCCMVPEKPADVSPKFQTFPRFTCIQGGVSNHWIGTDYGSLV